MYNCSFLPCVSCLSEYAVFLGFLCFERLHGSKIITTYFYFFSTFVALLLSYTLGKAWIRLQDVKMSNKMKSNKNDLYKPKTVCISTPFVENAL